MVDLRCRLGYVVLNLNSGCFPKCIVFNTKPRRSEMGENMKKSESRCIKTPMTYALKLLNYVAIEVAGLLVARFLGAGRSHTICSLQTGRSIG